LKYNYSYAQLAFYTWRWGNKDREKRKKRKSNKDSGGSDGGEFYGFGDDDDDMKEEHVEFMTSSLRTCYSCRVKIKQELFSFQGQKYRS